MQTNGTTLHHQPLLARLVEAGLNAVEMSLHTLDEDTFEELIGPRALLAHAAAGLAALAAFPALHVTLVIVLTARNATQIPALIETVADRWPHVRTVVLSPVAPVGDGATALELLVPYDVLGPIGDPQMRHHGLVMTDRADQTTTPMTFADALGESLRRTAYFAETHSIKGVLAADRLARRHPKLGDRFFADAVRLWQILPAPTVAGLMRRQVQWDAPLDDARVEGAIGRAVFPLAYVAAGVWVERRGLASLVERYRRRAIARLGHLGHSWTIWCSFHEALARLPDVAPPLTTRDAELLCGERFVELVAAQLAYNTPAQPDPDLAPLDGPAPDEVATLDAALAWPGFYGHTLITLGYLHRHRALLDDAAWRWAMARVRELAAQRTGGGAAEAVATAAPGPTASASEAEVDAAIVRLALEGPREVHSITLADAAHDVAAVATPRQRAHLVAALAAVTRWDPSA